MRRPESSDFEPSPQLGGGGEVEAGGFGQRIRQAHDTTNIQAQILYKAVGAHSRKNERKLQVAYKK
jgi:hypothetical protein